MKRVLFVQPPFFRFIGIHTRYFPYQFAGMGAYLKNSGHHVRILEGDKHEGYGKLDFSDQESSYNNYLQNLKTFSDPFWKTLEREIQNFKPNYIGITVWTTFIASAIRTAQYCKKITPSAIIIAGGPHVTLLPEDIKKAGVFDIGVIGEGEDTILEIVNSKPLNSIRGIFYSENGDIKQNEPRMFAKNLDDFGIPDRSLLTDKEKYDAEDMGLIMSSRGCPFKCAFCATAIWKNKVRTRSVENVIEEIKSVKEKYGTIYFTIKDDSFTVDKKRVYDFCRKLMQEKIDVYWECTANLSTLDRDMLVEMRSAGCIAIKVGIESGSDRIHKIINKKLKNEIIMSKMKVFDGTDIHVTCYLMMGIPGETRKDILKTLEFAYHIKPDFISISIYEIFPKTKLHRLGIENNTAIECMEVEDYFKVQPHNYFFANNKRHLAGMSYDEFGSIERHVKQKVHQYNRSPRSVYRRIKSRMPLYRKNAEYFFNDVKKFFKWV
jgi:anaerobic magnesium-protoporphyrin IX monomethyl ester cyclase